MHPQSIIDGCSCTRCTRSKQGPVTCKPSLSTFESPFLFVFDLNCANGFSSICCISFIAPFLKGLWIEQKLKSNILQFFYLNSIYVSLPIPSEIPFINLIYAAYKKLVFFTRSSFFVCDVYCRDINLTNTTQYQFFGSMASSLAWQLHM